MDRNVKDKNKEGRNRVNGTAIYLITCDEFDVGKWLSHYLHNAINEPK